MSEKILRWPDLKKKVPVSHVTIWRWEKDGHFPKRIQLGGNSAGWLESEVDDWIEQRAAER
ncbi:AlpA family transcriptional regulator [uncultured Desulfosarcina sp.]|uniref:helix-turn-helix transcriptional regulator n=1 Tax=uncultured Desulfosarcina sp. TaxID=218289 RepID=UPI0029C71DD7|nr:AlpA family transcriptional regulator [uncultured Desulfosarcina sp.]